LMVQSMTESVSMTYLIVAKYRNLEGLDYLYVDAASEEKARAWYHLIRSEDYKIQYVEKVWQKELNQVLRK